jgi:hypothetical protein
MPVEGWSFILSMFRTATAPSTRCAGRDDYFRSSNASSLMVAMPEKRWRSWFGAPERGNWRL